MTQFVRGALTRARRAGARIIFVTCDPGTELQTFVDLTIAPGVGAEVIAGSTRLKAGTATKMVLNMLTTGAMIRIGKTYGNLMVDVQTGSEKLKDRARRIVNIVTGLEYDDADKLLKTAHWNVKAAIVMQKTGLPYPKALSRLRKAHDSMREAIGEDIEPRLRGMLQGAAEASSNGTTSRSRDAALLIEQHFDVAVHLQERCGQPRRHRPLTDLPDALRLLVTRRDEHDAARLQDRPHAHRERFARHLRRRRRRRARRCRAASTPQRHPMRAREQLVAGLVEADVAVGADAENLQVDAAGAGDGGLVALALRVEIARGAVEEMNPLRPQVHAVEQVLVHEGAKAARMAAVDAGEFVQVEGGRTREVRLPSGVEAAKSRRSRRSACARSADRARASAFSRSATPRGRERRRDGVAARRTVIVMVRLADTIR